MIRSRAAERDQGPLSAFLMDEGYYDIGQSCQQNDKEHFTVRKIVDDDSE